MLLGNVALGCSKLSSAALLGFDKLNVIASEVIQAWQILCQPMSQHNTGSFDKKPLGYSQVHIYMDTGKICVILFADQNIFKLQL